MIRLFFIITLNLFVCQLSAQVPEIVAPFTSFDDVYFSNQNNDKVFLYTSSANPFVLKKINSNGSLSNVFSKPIPSDVFGVEEMSMYGDKGIARLSLMVPNDTMYKFWFYNGTSVDTSTLKFIRSAFDPAPKPVLNPLHAYIFDEKRIYKSNYTSSGTSVMFNSPLVGKITSMPIMLVENLNTVIWVDNGVYLSDSLMAPRRYHLYMKQGSGSATIIDSSTTSYFELKKNPISNDIFAFKISRSTNQPNTSIYMFTTTSGLWVDSNLHFIPREVVGGKIVGDRLTSGGAFIGFGSYNMITDSMNVFPYLNEVKFCTEIVSNGSACYFLADQFGLSSYKPYYTNGDTLIKLSNNEYSTASNWKKKGAFCGDNFWANKYYTTGFSFAIDSFKEQYTPQGIHTPYYTPNDTVDYSFDIVSDGLYIYYSGFHSNNIAFPSTLYRLDCGAPVGITTLDLDQDIILVYPNPATDYLTVKIAPNKDFMLVALKDITGRLIKNCLLYSGTNTISLSGISSGIYILQGDGWTKKFVKE